MSVTRRTLSLAREYDALLVTSLIWFLAKFVRYTFPPLFETFQVEYGVSTATLGLLFTGLVFAYGGMQFPSGALADRFGRGRVIVGGVLLVAGAALLLFSTQAFGALVAAMVLFGVGTGVHKTVAIDLVAAIYPERTGRALGSMDAFGELSGVAAPAAVVAVLGLAMGWNLVYLLVALAAVGLAAAFHFLVAGRAETRAPSRDDGKGGRDGEERRDNEQVHDGREGCHPEEARGVPPDPDPSAGSDASAYLAPFRDPGFALFVAVVVAYSVVWNAVTAFLPLYLSTTKGLGTATAGLLFAVLFAAGIVQPVTGALSDRVGRNPVMVATLSVQGAALLALLFARGPLVIGAVVVVLGLGIHGFRTPRDAHLVAIIPSAVSGGTLGMVRTVMIGVGSASPAVVGLVSEVAGFDAAFLGLVVLTAATAVAVVVLWTGGGPVAPAGSGDG